jgi:hypothetical protein
VWEAIAAGTMLVEQANPATARFLIPWRHYLPWQSFDDIVRIAGMVERHPETAARVAAEAGRWVERHYNPRRFWAAVVDHAFRFAPSSM